MTDDTEENLGKTGRKAAKEDKKPKVLKPSNLTKLRQELADFLEEMDAKKDDQEKLNGEFAVDISNIKEAYANKTGHSRKTLTMVYTHHRRMKKLEDWRKEAEQSDVEAFDEVMAACEGIKDTPLFRAARERMAVTAETTKQ